MKNYIRGSIYLLLCICIIFGSLELFAFFIYPRISRIQNRTVKELCDAKQIRKTDSLGKPIILLIGNSLMFDGIDFDLLKKGTDSLFTIKRLGIEQTQYLDWYYGLKNLFSQGMKPSLILICLGPEHYFGNGIRTEVFAHDLLKLNDLFQIKKDAQLNNTNTSLLAFAHLSSWLGNRTELVKWIMSLIIPGLDEMTSLLQQKRNNMPSDTLFLNTIRPRFFKLDSLCRSYGSNIAILLPSIQSHKNSTDILISEANHAGIRVIIPVIPGQFDASLFKSDRYHLNETGAKAYTASLNNCILRSLTPLFYNKRQ